VTKQRAQYVLERKGRFGELIYAFRHPFLGEHTPTRVDGITEKEDEFIRAVWSLMDGSKSYYDAVVVIAEGT
jgi:hypothetical protein